MPKSMLPPARSGAVKRLCSEAVLCCRARMLTPVPSVMLPVEAGSCERTEPGTVKVRASPRALQMKVVVLKIGLACVPPAGTPVLPKMVMMSEASPPVQFSVTPLERMMGLAES